MKQKAHKTQTTCLLGSVISYEYTYKTFFRWFSFKRVGLKMNMFTVIDLYTELDDDEVLRIELINGSKIYCLPSDNLKVATTMIKIIKPLKKDKRQQIIIDIKSITVVCTMSRETYDLKLSRGELYV